MLRRMSLALVPVAFVALLVGCGGDQKSPPAKGGSDAKAPSGEKKTAMQTTCPVMGMPIDKANFTDYEGKRIYFCTKDCIEAFKKDPDKYMKQMETAGVVLEKAPAADSGTKPAGEEKPM